MATIKWAVTTDGTFDFNDPANWQFGTVPNGFDIAQFDQPVADTWTGNATVAELLITDGLLILEGAYTMSGAQATELSVAAGAQLAIDVGASISGTGNISVTDGAALIILGALSGGGATFTNNAQLILLPGIGFQR